MFYQQIIKHQIKINLALMSLMPFVIMRLNST